MVEDIEAEIDQEIATANSKDQAYDLIDLDDVKIKTHTEIDPHIVGHVDEITEEIVHTTLITSKMMHADGESLVHSGFIGSAGEYAALAVVNEVNGMVYSVNSQYFACARVGDSVKYKATVRHIEGRKRDVDVIGKIDAIKIYEAHIVVVIPEYHPLKIKLLDIAEAN